MFSEPNTEVVKLCLRSLTTSCWALRSAPTTHLRSGKGLHPLETCGRGISLPLKIQQRCDFSHALKGGQSEVFTLLDFSPWRPSVTWMNQSISLYWISDFYFEINEKLKCTPIVGQIKFNFSRCIFYVQIFRRV